MRKYIIILVVSTLLVGCATSKPVTQLVHDIRTDTVYLSNVQYDSIYLFQDRMMDRSKDTIYLRDVSIEYRYKLLRDTVRMVERDSIPYQVTVVEIKEKTRPITWFDRICRACFWFICVALLLAIIRKVKPFVLKL